MDACAASRMNSELDSLDPGVDVSFSLDLGMDLNLDPGVDVNLTRGWT